MMILVQWYVNYDDISQWYVNDDDISSVMEQRQSKNKKNKNCWDFGYNKQITAWLLGPQAIWPWSQAAINLCMALANML